MVVKSLNHITVYILKMIIFAISFTLGLIFSGLSLRSNSWLVWYKFLPVKRFGKKFKYKTDITMALWFECKVRYDKMMENGTVKKVNEPYLVDALSFTEAEARIIEEMTPFISGEFSISAVKKTKISEIFFDDSADKYYMVKVNFITLDEKSGVEKKSASFILTQASDLEGALSRFKEGMKGTMADYDIASIAETPLMDVYPLDLSSDKTEKPGE